MYRRLLSLPLALFLLMASAPSWATDFTGTYVIDLKASDSLDPLLKAQGVSWMKRKAVASLTVTQVYAQEGNVITLEIQNSVQSSTRTMRVDGEARTVEGELGQVEVRHVWDGDTLVTTQVPASGKGTVIMRRSLSEDGRTLTQHITLKKVDGATVELDRIFRKS